jgi:hypothetical protein
VVPSSGSPLAWIGGSSFRDLQNGEHVPAIIIKLVEIVYQVFDVSLENVTLPGGIYCLEFMRKIQMQFMATRVVLHDTGFQRRLYYP